MTERSGSQLSREALQRAVSGAEPALERLLDNVPAMLAEAARRREEMAAPAAAIRAVGSIWLPRFAVATAALLLAAVVWPQRPARHDTTSPLDGFIVTGSVSSRVADPVLDALVR